MAVLRWNGEGSLPGIPARDLTEEEVAKFGCTFLLRTGLYYEVKEQKPDKVKLEKEVGNDWNPST